MLELKVLNPVLNVITPVVGTVDAPIYRISRLVAQVNEEALKLLSAMF